MKPDSGEPAERERIGTTVDVDAVLRRLEDAAPVAPNGKLLALAAMAIRYLLRPAPVAEGERERLLERVAQLAAHRGCLGVEHDPANGKIHGYCVVCGVPWPCEVAALRAPTEREPEQPIAYESPNWMAGLRTTFVTRCTVCGHKHDIHCGDCTCAGSAGCHRQAEAEGSEG